MIFQTAKAPKVLLAVIILSSAAAGLIAFKQTHPLGASVSEPSGSSDAVEKMRETLSVNRSLLAQYERDQASLRAEVIRRRRLYEVAQISKTEVQESEQAFVAALNRVHQMRNEVMEADIAMTEALLGQKVERMPALPVNGFSETADWSRFNGSVKWSLKQAPRIESYFSHRFGRRLPITALGQSKTHNRLGFDHHDAMDVALHPDSVEGKALIEQLKKMGIPFVAFRGPVQGASTGPHIHVGRPSGRLTHG